MNVRASTKGNLWRNTAAALVVASIGAWFIYQSSSKRPNPMNQKRDLKSVATTLAFTDAEYESALLPVRKHAARLGKELFFDARLSQNAQISCATCHNPDLYFSDSKPTSVGLGQVAKNAPSVVNSRFQNWFFWNGRADSLAAQTLGPFTHPAEQGLSYTRLARIIRTHYLKQYEEIFGPWPTELSAKTLATDASPPILITDVSPEVAAYVLSTIEYGTLRKILQASQSQRKTPTEMVAKILQTPPASIPSEWTQRFVKFPESVQSSLFQVIANIGIAIAAFEKNLIAINAPFDAFIQKWRALDAHQKGRSQQTEVQEAFVPGFGADEFAGMKVFVNHQCDLCHSGNRFTDDQFHNIGLGVLDQDSLPDLGRSEGVHIVANDRFNCDGKYLNKANFPDEITAGCEMLEFLNFDAIEFVGAFKTPSLRNVGKTAPYFHDGRAATLDDVLNHYQELKATNAIGHREESLQPLGLNDKERNQLKAFLNSLTSDVTDLSL